MNARLRTVLALLALIAISIWACCPNPCPNPCPDCGKELGLTIELNAECNIEPAKPHLSVSPDRHNHVRWHNRTSVAQTVSINEENWCFMEPRQDITVEPGKYSAWFTVDEATPVGKKFKAPVSPLWNPNCPPDEPGFTTDP